MTRILSKRRNFVCELINPRPSCIKGINHHCEIFKADMAEYYDLLVGLHPDEALPELIKSALTRPVVLITCCNFGDDQKTGYKELLETKILPK
ncbi:MAG: hypothetical protein ACUVWN_09750 [bacterium]